MSVSPSAMRRVMRELSELENNPPEGIRIQTNEEDMLDVTGIIEGPEGTPYAGGYFRVKFKFTNEFPAAPPKCWFATKIFHPNVGATGEICVNTLKKDWKSTYGIGHILVTVKCLLIYPNPESALDEEAGKLLLEDYDSYCSRAKLITSVHATPKVKPAEFNKPSVVEKEAAEAKASSSKQKPPTDASPSPTIASSSADPAVPAPSTTTKIPSTTASKTASPVVSPPLSTTSSVSPPSSLSTSRSTSATLAPPTVPSITRKSASPAPPISPLKTSLAADKGGLGIHIQKERHPSPSPLSTADANVGGGKPGLGVGIGMASAGGVGGITGTKAVKRAATNSAATGAEKRKKALKRL
ncbi:hypothetical protein D9619_009176 [Psilocybe cf. subviscida]|uniref:E2 ubiquitin-conjugating enzyme n=1 Tax=Psilocybe cf. subviscida TaxID=2480587 RepID=A0A8H5FAI0_9AGAR|nr:hypothetical protein D9619_009176 [Psilocybe cf. subviscida]